MSFDFDRDLLEASLNDTTFVVYGEKSGYYQQPTVSYDTLTDVVSLGPLLGFFPGERVFVSVTDDVQSAMGQPFTEGYVLSITTAVTNGSGIFNLTDTVGLVGSTPYSLASGDFDLDGDLDIACVDRNSNLVEILSNNGGGDFSFSSSLPISAFP